MHAKMRTATRNKYGISDSATVIGYVGRFVRDKGIQELVQAWEEIKADRDDIRVLMVGDRDAAVVQMKLHCNAFRTIFIGRGQVGT